MTDANYNVIMTIDDAAHPAERIFYKAYGEPECFPFGDVDGDYDVDSADTTLLISIKNNSGSPYNILGDLNLDGQITQADVNLISNYAGMLGGTNILSTNEEQNDIGYAAYIWNDESQNYHVRNREYSPKFGRWLQRDPAGYVDGMSMYSYVNAQPTTVRDPLGKNSGWNYSTNEWDLGGRNVTITKRNCLDYDWACVQKMYDDMIRELEDCTGNMKTNHGLAPWLTECIQGCLDVYSLGDPLRVGCIAACFPYGFFAGCYNVPEIAGYWYGCWLVFNAELYAMEHGGNNECCIKWSKPIPVTINPTRPEKERRYAW